MAAVLAPVALLIAVFTLAVAIRTYQQTLDLGRQLDAYEARRAALRRPDLPE